MVGALHVAQEVQQTVLYNVELVTGGNATLRSCSEGQLRMSSLRPLQLARLRCSMLRLTSCAILRAPQLCRLNDLQTQNRSSESDRHVQMEPSWVNRRYTHICHPHVCSVTNRLCRA